MNRLSAKPIRNGQEWIIDLHASHLGSIPGKFNERVIKALLRVPMGKGRRKESERVTIGERVGASPRVATQRFSGSQDLVDKYVGRDAQRKLQHPARTEIPQIIEEEKFIVTQKH
ncbi:MAG: hypothetical protein HYZ71_12960, partial [Deltaproteobacteria bacterium]|nr:hypothetical protein [Deltaproteobacteria bacterium]